MRLISLSNLVSQASETFRRFPLSLLSAIATTVAMICVMETNGSGDHAINQVYWKIAFTLSLFTVLSFSISICSDRYSLKRTTGQATYGVALIAAVLFFISLPTELTDASSIRWVALAIAMHLMVSFTPFLFRNEMNGMWQFNKSLFIHFLIGAVYSAVLFAGLAGAMGAVDVLFEIHIDPKFYADLWFVIAGIFNTWFFLSGVPRDVPSLERATDYPKGLKVFTVHVLLPLITVYLIILYLYGAKILITSVWPAGYVAYMVIAFSVFGLLSFLLIYPLRDDSANRWVKVYSHLFNYSLLLPIVLLYISIFKRINSYGWTVDRYFVVLLALWLTFVTAYQIITSGRKIRMIPLSLCIFALLSTFGPWGAFEVSKKSQLYELTSLLNNYHVLEGGKVDSSKTHDIEQTDVRRIRSILVYLDHMHGYQTLKPFFSQNIDSLLTAKNLTGHHVSYPERTQVFLDLMNLRATISEDSTYETLYYQVLDHSLFNSAGYDLTTSFSHSSPEEKDSLAKELFLIGSDSLHYTYSQVTQTITLSYKNLEPLVLNTKTMFDAMPAYKEDYPPDLMMVSAENADWKARVCFHSLNVTKGKGQTIIRNGQAILMLKLLEAK